MDKHFIPGCSNYPQAFFAEETGVLGSNGHSMSVYPLGLKTIRRICAACPAREVCLELAMDREGAVGSKDRYGMWGGLSPIERYRLYATLSIKKEAM